MARCCALAIERRSLGISQEKLLASAFCMVLCAFFSCVYAFTYLYVFDGQFSCCRGHLTVELHCFFLFRVCLFAFARAYGFFLFRMIHLTVVLLFVDVCLCVWWLLHVHAQFSDGVFPFILDVVCEDPLTIKLRFAPAGRGKADFDYYLSAKENKYAVIPLVLAQFLFFAILLIFYFPISCLF